MDEFTRKFNTAEDKEQQIHHILTAVYEALKEKGYEVIACEPFIRGDVAGYKNHTLEEAMAACDYAVITLMHTPFVENKALIATKPYYDCVGLMRK